MRSNRNDDDRYRAPALDKGLDVLEFLSSQPNGLTRAEIVKAMGRSASELYRMIERLVARGYVTRSPEGDRYALTMKLFVLGSQHPPVRRLVARAQPLMDRFTERTQQSIHLAMPDRGMATVVAQASGPANWEFRLRIGARLDLLTTGSGLTLMAFLSHAKRLEILKGTPANMARLENARSQLEKIRRQGYRVGSSLQIVGVRDLSVPVLGPSKDAVAVLTCPYLKRVDCETADAGITLGHLREAAGELSID